MIYYGTRTHPDKTASEPKLERIDYYATTYECPQCKETEDPRFMREGNSYTDPDMHGTTPVLQGTCGWCL